MLIIIKCEKEQRMIIILEKYLFNFFGSEFWLAYPPCYTSCKTKLKWSRAERVWLMFPKHSFPQKLSTRRSSRRWIGTRRPEE
jgi:hypothetical protein